MLSRRLYYHFKPYVPWHLRMGVRRIIARAQRRRHAQSWPINEAAGEVPPKWPGWPDGKKFALILTHDVEGSVGLGKCREVMALEQSLGFRSSFNFVPEGEYLVSPEFRHELTGNGFEVGVHDLRHDGKLYSRRAEFPQNARTINNYLKEWDARGFRSGFMLHNADWLDGLDIEYDASTFDTDPFEPQPEGVHTIFPFWVPRAGGGYVELPYTLPQDSTLFLVLKEKNPAIWKQKLDWIVARGGMALLNIHPDYLTFKNKPGASEYPVAHYEEFLHYVKKNYAGLYWNELPKNVAAWYRKTCVTPQNVGSGVPFTRANLLRQKKAAVVLYSYYASDPRPRRAAEALVRAGMEVDVICLRQNSEEPARENINGVNVHRVPLKRRRAGKLTYVLQYFSFLASSFFMLTAWSFKKRFQLVHVHNMPDFLVFSALVPKLRGAKIILDLHDPMPELMMSIYNLKKESASIRLLKFLEKISLRFADRVVTVNLACKKIFSARSCDAKKIQVVMNAPDENIFQFRNGAHFAPPDAAKKFVIMFHGSIVERHGLDLAVEALQLVQKNIPGAELRIYGAATPFLDSVMAMAKKNGLADSVNYFGPKPMDGIAAAILDCDVGIIPNRRSIFTEINTPTRIFEYLSLGKPVIAPDVPGITDYFGGSDLVFFELGNARNLAKKLLQVHASPAEMAATVQRGRQIYQRHNWSREKEMFLNGVADLLSSRIPQNFERA